MFKPLETAAHAPVVTIYVDGRPVAAREGETLALALLENGVDDFRRTPVSQARRGPFCLMGACFDCLVELDGLANVQACCVEVRAGQRVRRQCGARHAECGA
ncbi:MAG: (2Fe-2S)-binding protein [Betaproteobacteria bacterium]|nr:(2Fe-2S)-binding protein [Betaproteobacteria bacterium]MBU6512938.1 (2Fe-2S)-binding protein [Betaproteobacteria bacterium]MDE1955947.1 (2Fe-2S)-binding protein [Betaproteobacteria bacterium]MDE2151868.1 (2Fe-2S)-binding protein [Betaproteobacteria bacterium]MDE2479991.1 (2Fe-2S)-binding protein [Betaproteobacteria bacterium]